MRRPPVPQPFIALQIATAILLPIAICLFVAVGTLLSAMGDATGATALRWVGLICGLIWTLDLTALVISLAVNSLGGNDDSNSDESE